MQLVIPKVIERLDLGSYNETMKGQVLHVWVDPPRRMFKEFDDIVFELEKQAAEEVQAELATREPQPSAESTNKSFVELLKGNVKALLDASSRRRKSRAAGTDKRLLAWYSEILSQNKENLCSVEELARVEDENPALFHFILEKVWAMIAENRDRSKKK